MIMYMPRFKIAYFCFLVCLSSIFSCSSVRSISSNFHDLEELLADKVSFDTIFISDTLVNDLRLTLSYNGRKPLVILPSSPGGVIVSGNSSIRINESRNLILSNFYFHKSTSKTLINIVSSKDVTLNNNYFDSCGRSATGGSLIRIADGSSRNFVSGNTFDSSRSLGIVIMTSNESDKRNQFNRISNNIFVNVPDVNAIYPNSNGNGLESILIGRGIPEGRWWKLNTHIYHNLFQNIVGDGAEIISVKSSGNEIYGNTFLDNPSGLTIRYGNSNVVKDNIFIDTKSGIRSFGRQHLIQGNIFSGGDFGVQLPAATLSSDVFLDSTNTYFQSDRVKIEGNFFVGQNRSAIVIGNSASKARSVFPNSISVSDNTAVLQSVSSKFVDVVNQSSTLENRRNRVSRSDRVLEQKSKFKVVDNYDFAIFNLKRQPMSIYSSEIGASWKRPKVVKTQ